MHCYRVILEQNKPPLVCITTGNTSYMPVGARECSSLLPGTMVVVLQHPQLVYGLIMAVIPPLDSDAADCRSDQVHQASRCGLHLDKVHSKTLELAGVLNANAGRPVDGLTVGEAGWIAETGLRIWLDSFMAQLAVDEHCGVFAFYHDQLLRLAGHNLQLLSAAHALEVWNDHNELAVIEGIATYPWEQLGALKSAVTPFSLKDESAIQKDQAYYSSYEPQHDDQVPFHRYRDFSGYMGQGKKIFLSAAPPDAELFRLSQAKTIEIPGLFEQQLLLTGELGIRSAMGITLAKRPNIPTPRRIKLPADKRTDTETNYKFSGTTGQGAEHKVQSTIPLAAGGQGILGPNDTPPREIAASARGPSSLMDLHAHLFNWQGSHQFHYHENSWELPEESESQTVPTNAEPLQFSALQGQQYLAPPEGVKVPIDHRYGEATVYPNYSFISLLPEGGIVLGDGYGAEIRMSGGSITLSAPGDVWLQPGRNVQIWGGNDVVVRAKDSIDLSTSEKDIRIKAEHNMQLLAGNGDYGGILLESQSATQYNFEKDGEEVVSGGIMMKCPKGDVATWSRGVYMRAGGGDVEPGGAIILDSNKGQTAVVINASDVLQFVTNTSAINFSNEGEVVSSTVFSQNVASIGSSMRLRGELHTQGGILAKGAISTTGSVSSGTGFIGHLKDENLQKAQQILDTANTELTNTSTNGTTNFARIFTDYLYQEFFAGHDATIQKIKFKFRTTEQYGTEQFAMMECRWQQLARLSEQQMPRWVETDVANTWPYPGRDAMIDTATLFQQDLQLFDVATGNSKDRDTDQAKYEQPEIPAPNPVMLGTTYRVIGP